MISARVWDGAWATMLAASVALAARTSASDVGRPPSAGPPPDAGPPPRYAAAQLDCARFAESSRGELATQTGRRTRREAVGRAGLWRFRAAPESAGVAVEAWYDSLAVWRRPADGARTPALVPDTDGLIGGRYRGLLMADGTYLPRVRPFVPDELAEVADLGRALDDLLPRLPAAELRPGAVWADSAGLEIRRLADSLGAGGPFLRFELVSRRERRGTTPVTDSADVEVHETSVERGTFVWHPARGLLRRERRVTVETLVLPGGVVRQPVRSRLEQVVTLARLGQACPPAPR